MTFQEQMAQGTYLRVDPHTAGIISTENQVGLYSIKVTFIQVQVQVNCQGPFK